MSAAVHVAPSGDGYVVKAPGGRPVRFTRHDQALDYAEAVLRQQARERSLAKGNGGYWLRTRRASGSLVYDVLDRRGRLQATLSSRYLALNKIDQLARRMALVERPCITCRKPFESEGIHNRMCADCNARAQTVVAI